MLKWLGYDTDEVLTFNAKRVCGLWFCMIGLVISSATIFGGNMSLNPFIFAPGYAIGFIISHNRKMEARLSTGPSSAFQNKIGNLAIVSMFVLMIFISGPFFISMNWRMIWLGTLLATGLHFFPFYFVVGKSMIFIGTLCTISAVLGMILIDVPFMFFGIADGFIKISFGIYLFFFSKPSTNRIK